MERRTKVYNSSSYIGSGNQASVFNRRPKKAFQKIRSIYGEHILGETGKLNHTSYGHLSQAEKETIRLRVQRIVEQQKKRQLYAYVWFGVTCLAGLVTMIIVMNIK